jgi:hypothetical protein
MTVAWDGDFIDVGTVMRILEMILPRLELMAELASDRDSVRDPVVMAQLREDYRYMSSVCRSLLPDLEEDLVDLPEGVSVHAPVEEKISQQMALIRRTNRLHRAVDYHLAERTAALGKTSAESS